MLIDQLIGKDVCISKKELTVMRENVVIVYFDFDKNDLKPISNEKLDSIYRFMMEDSLATIQVGAHTDGFGTVEYNNKLSDRRAEACVDYLVKKGIDPSRISFESFGKCCPAAAETTLDGEDDPDARALNRRALIHVKKN
jgi:outer membrane protein OmpA-like peptidoglycan-associated protein